jgi:hypothetical protein
LVSQTKFLETIYQFHILGVRIDLCNFGTLFQYDNMKLYEENKFHVVVVIVVVELEAQIYCL